MQAAKWELNKLTPTKVKDQLAVRKATLYLDEDLKAIAARQKHIKIADHSKLSWQVVVAYESDELVSDSDNEKRLFKAKKMAERKSKHEWASCAGARK